MGWMKAERLSVISKCGDYTISVPSLLFLIITFLPHKLDEIGMKNGPVIWVDVADTQVCVGSAGVVIWAIKVKLH